MGYGDGIDLVILGANDKDLHLIIGAAFSGRPDEKAKSARIQQKMKIYGYLFAPLCWIDEKLTGVRIEHDLKH